MKYLGVPYSKEELGQADLLAEKQAQEIVKNLSAQGVANSDRLAQSEMIALIAYMQSLGKQTKDSRKTKGSQ